MEFQNFLELSVIPDDWSGRPCRVGAGSSAGLRSGSSSSLRAGTWVLGQAPKSTLLTNSTPVGLLSLRQAAELPVGRLTAMGARTAGPLPDAIARSHVDWTASVTLSLGHSRGRCGHPGPRWPQLRRPFCQGLQPACPSGACSLSVSPRKKLTGGRGGGHPKRAAPCKCTGLEAAGICLTLLQLPA